MGSVLVAERSVERDALDEVQVRVALRGLVDLDTQPILRAALDRAMAEPGVRRVVVDMRDLTLLDSTGIATLVAAYRAGAAAGVTVRVVNPEGVVRRVLEITGVLQTLGG
ncbi:STAS domain-containing protein [Dactylosporangium salmoneum]|uniref:Anti-sigma factor antagonist n=1 Tax=Dactylosporangium salmoneum TaxID=53361 RepID=A0ABP5S861_9ACTN